VPEVDQYSYTFKELTELMIKQAGIHEGRWMMQVTFGFGALNGGPTPDQIMPTGFVGLQKIGLMKAQPDSPEILTVDAAAVNPASSVKKPPSKRSRDVESE
jgi:hypothetical protein